MVPSFSVQYPLKMQISPKASQELYPVIISPVSRKTEHLYLLSWQTLSVGKAWQLAQNAGYVRTKAFLTRAKWFLLFTPHPRSYQVLFRGNLWGAGNVQPPGAKGMPKLLLRSAPPLFNNRTSKKNTGKNNNCIPSKNSSKSFLGNYTHRKSFVWALVLSKPSHFLCQ